MNSETVVAAFCRIFPDSRPYGDQTFIIGKDPINRAMKRNLINHYLEYENEIPLLVFDYKGELTEGFVITNYRIIWRYGMADYSGDVDLEDIQRAEIGRVLLARTMQITDVTGKKYSRIYLTGMDETEKFVSQFNDFISLINGVDDDIPTNWSAHSRAVTAGNSARESDGYVIPPRTRVSGDQDKLAEEHLQKLLNFVEKTFSRPEFIFENYIYHLGRDEKSNDKIKKAVEAYAQLKSGEVPLVCCDITAFGGAEDGFLLTDRGIYIHNPYKNTYYFSYDNISSIELRGVLVKDIYVNNLKIEDPAGFGNDENRKLAALLHYFKNSFGA